MAELPEHFKSTPAGAARVPRAVLETHQRERVVALVTPIFAKRGYQGTTVDDLLASGKVGVGNFYALFQGKEDCFLACFDQILGVGRERIASRARHGRDWAQAAYLGLGALMEVILADRFAARLVLVEAQSAGARAMARYDALLGEAVGWLAGGRAGHLTTAAELPPNFERAAVAGLAFYLQQILLEVDEHAAADLLTETAGLLLEPIVGPAELARARRAGATTPA
jgi:AcrR family transcriptional regulator